MLLENVEILHNEQCAQTAALAPVINNDTICARYPYTYPYAIGPDCEVHTYICILLFTMQIFILFSPPNII